MVKDRGLWKGANLSRREPLTQVRILDGLSPPLRWATESNKAERSAGSTGLHIRIITALIVIALAGVGVEPQMGLTNQRTVEANLDILCVQLLTRIPAASRHWRNEPLRMTRYVLSSPVNRSWAAQATWNRMRGKPSSANDYNDKMREWLFRTKCEVCRACDLPLLDKNFAEIL